MEPLELDVKRAHARSINKLTNAKAQKAVRTEPSHHLNTLELRVLTGSAMAIIKMFNTAEVRYTAQSVIQPWPPINRTINIPGSTRRYFQAPDTSAHRTKGAHMAVKPRLTAERRRTRVVGIGKGDVREELISEVQQPEQNAASSGLLLPQYSHFRIGA